MSLKTGVILPIFLFSNALNSFVYVKHKDIVPKSPMFVIVSTLVMTIIQG